MIKTLLVFPPVWLPEAPFLSTPMLTAYLRERGVDAHQRDLNVQFWSRFMEPESIAAIYGRIRSHWVKLQRCSSLSGPDTALAALLAGFVNVPEKRFVHEVRDGTIPPATYRNVVQRVSEFCIGPVPPVPLSASVPSEIQNYHDLLYSDISLSLYAHATRDLQRIVEEDENNPFVAYFLREVIPEVECMRPRIFGISIPAINQAVPAFTLARLVKEALGDVHTVIGGSWCTQVHPVLSARLPQFPYLDSLVIYEGEEPLFQLCRALAEGQYPQDIPNHYLNRPTGALRPSRRSSTDMSVLPTPDLDGLPLDQYDFKQTATIQASRGCYWGKCTFCSYPVLEPRYKVRSPERVVEDVATLKDRYGIHAVGFVDALLSPSYARRFAAVLQTRQLGVRWTMLARLEKAFTFEVLEAMARSGCSMISWGLESGSVRVLEVIAKSIDLANAQRILAEAARLGIHNRVLVMYGHPTEQFGEALETVAFLEENFDSIHSISYNFYHPEQGTPMEGLAVQLGIGLERESANDLSFGYRWSSSLSPEEQAQVKARFEEISARLGEHREVRRLRHPDAPLPPFSTAVSLPGNEYPRREIISTLEEVEGRERRVVYEVLSFQ